MILENPDVTGLVVSPDSLPRGERVGGEGPDQEGKWQGPQFETWEEKGRVSCVQYSPSSLSSDQR